MLLFIKNHYLCPENDPLFWVIKDYLMNFINKIFTSLLCSIAAFALFIILTYESLAFLAAFFTLIGSFMVLMIMDIVRSNESKKKSYYAVIAVLMWFLLTVLIDAIIGMIIGVGFSNRTVLKVSVAIGLLLSIVFTILIYKNFEARHDD